MNSSEITPEFEALLDYLKHNRGCDLTVYKPSTLMRRFQYRMQSIKIDSYQGYLKYLQSHSEEHVALLNDVLINVTNFFRDPDDWSYLAAEIIPKILANKQPDEPIRVWSAGCAAGQEIYSFLILLAEALGIESCLQRVYCYATDADELALTQARQGIYSALEVSGIPPNLLQKYFQQTEQGYIFYSELRRRIIFGRHDLSKDAPMSKIDLLICRNVLIYFNPEIQTSVLIRFHFALQKTGFLFLGKSEMLVNRRQIFTPISMQHRIYVKGLHLDLKDHLCINPKSQKEQAAEPLLIQNHFWQTAFETYPVAQFAIDLKGRLMDANQQANLLFELTIDDWNRSFQDLEPGKLIAAHTLEKPVYYSRRPVILKNVERITSQGIQYFEVMIVPVLNSRKRLIGSILTFLEETDCKLLTNKLKDTHAELERTLEELETTKAELEAAYREIQMFIRDAHFGS